MKNPFRLTAALLAAGVLAAGAWFVLDDGDSSSAGDAADTEILAPGDADEPIGDDIAARPATAESVDPFDDEAIEAERVEVDGGAPVARPDKRLVVSGRVVDKQHAPIAGAAVRLYVARRGGRRFGRRRQPRYLESGNPVKTADNGRFEFTVTGFAQSSIEVGARHADFAPGVVRRSWTVESGALDVGDLTLEIGATVYGKVLAKGGVPVPESKIRFRTSDRANRARLDELVGEIHTDDRGLFEVAHVPPGKFRLVAEAPRYLPGVSAELEAASGKRLAAGTLALELGSALNGVVLDLAGQPIAGADVEGSFSGRGNDAKLRKQIKDLQTIARGTGMKAKGARKHLQQIVRSSRRAAWVRKRTKTDERGEFALDGLPNAALRLRVRHENYIDEDRDPLVAAPNQRVEVRMYRRLAVTGVVVDAVTAQPVRLYGIRARRMRGQPGLPSPGQQNAKRQAMIAKQRAAEQRKMHERQRAMEKKMQAAIAKRAKKPMTPAQRKKLEEQKRRMQERQARRAQAEQRRRVARINQDSRRTVQQTKRVEWLRARLGPSGRVPGPIPKPTARDAGKFEIEGLQPGSYVFDVGGPGYVSQAAGPFELSRGKAIPRVQIRLERGIVVAGRVLNRVNGGPVPGATVELFLPPPEERAQPSDPLMRAIRGDRRGVRVARTTTGKDGAFVLPPQRAGQFRLTVRAQHFNSHREDNLQLHRGRDERNLLFQLGPAGRIHGKVLNLEPNTKAHVIIASTAGNRRNVPVDPKTGTYDADDLEAGDYFVRLHREGLPGGQFRAAIEAITRPGASQPDVRLREGSEVRFNLDASLDQLGSVKGRVTWNGRPANGIELKLVAPKGAANKAILNDPAGRRLVERLLAGALRARSDREGKFAIELVPPGHYTIELRRAQGGKRSPRGRRRDRPLLRHSVLVSSGRPSRLQLAIETGHLRLQVVDQKTKKAARGRVLLALASEVAGQDPKLWGKLPSFQMTGLRGGIADFREIPAGEYAYLIFGGGLQANRGQVFVGSGPTESRRIEVVRRSRPRKAGAKRGKSRPVRSRTKK